MRRIEPGVSHECVGCDGRVKFEARRRGQYVIANVYVVGVWNRVEAFHLQCYEEAGRPWGPAREAPR